MPSRHSKPAAPRRPPSSSRAAWLSRTRDIPQGHLGTTHRVRSVLPSNTSQQSLVHGFLASGRDDQRRTGSPMITMLTSQ